MTLYHFLREKVRCELMLINGVEINVKAHLHMINYQCEVMVHYSR